MLFGDYKIIQEIGKGPFGEVFLAEHRFLKKLYALKILKGVDEEKFEREMPPLASLEHPHLCKIHAFGVEEGKAYIVSDPLVDEGMRPQHLFDRLLQESLSEEEIASLLAQLASVLDYAHGRQVVHKGLKPSNLFLTKRNHLVVSDMGLSRIAGGEKELFASLSALELLSVYPYLSPEQKNGGFVGTKSDVYSFGVLLYALLMKVTPEGAFPLPGKSDKGYKMGWDSLLLRCLDPNSAQRPSALSELIVKARGERKTGVTAAAISAPVQPTLFEIPKKTAETMQVEEESSLAVMEQPKLKLNPTEIARPVYEEDPGSIFQLESTVARYIPTKKEIPDITPIPTEMVIVPAGEYVRGCNAGARDERPAHKILLSSFAMDVHPITNEQFVRFLEVMGGEKDVNNNDIIRLRESRIKRIGGKLMIESGYAKHPVVGVSWYGAVAYAKWVGKRLPTEAEWEIVATGGMEGLLYPTGSDIERSQANFFSSDTMSVMSYPPSEMGFYDLAGNVYEWCQDWYDYNTYESSVQEPENPQGPQQGVYRVLRGGCWKSLKDDLRCAHRHRNNPGTVNKTYGFRCAADVE